MVAGARILGEKANDASLPTYYCARSAAERLHQLFVSASTGHFCDIFATTGRDPVLRKDLWRPIPT
jgi:hypothetical protein